MKDKVTKLKPDARKATEYEVELVKLRKEKEEREKAEMTELELKQSALDERQKEIESLQAKYDKALKDNVYEKTISTRLAGYDDTDRDLVRSLYDAAPDFADVEELNGLLDTIDTKWKAHMDAYGGERRVDVGGSTRNRMVREPGADQG